MTEALEGGSRGVWFATWHRGEATGGCVSFIQMPHQTESRLVLSRKRFTIHIVIFFSVAPSGFSIHTEKTGKSTGHEQSDRSVSEVSVHRASAFRTVQSQAYSIPDCPIQFIKSIWVSAGPAFPVSGRYKLYISQRWYSSCKRNNILCISIASQKRQHLPFLL